MNHTGTADSGSLGTQPGLYSGRSLSQSQLEVTITGDDPVSYRLGNAGSDCYKQLRYNKQCLSVGNGNQ